MAELLPPENDFLSCCMEDADDDDDSGLECDESSDDEEMDVEGVVAVAVSLDVNKNGSP